MLCCNASHLLGVSCMAHVVAFSKLFGLRIVVSSDELGLEASHGFDRLRSTQGSGLG